VHDRGSLLFDKGTVKRLTLWISVLKKQSQSGIGESRFVLTTEGAIPTTDLSVVGNAEDDLRITLRFSAG
jgi:hypothetical protein